MPQAERDLKIYGKCAYLFVDDPESIKAAKEAMRKNVLEFLEKENILQIITHTQKECSPDSFPIIPDSPEIKATVGWKLDMNPLLKEQPEQKHGHWIEQDDYNDTYYKCSVCGEPWVLIDGTPLENGMHFCPKCGARMESEVKPDES